METERAVRIKIYARGVDAAAQNMYIYIDGELMTRGLRGRSQLRPALPDLDNANAGNIALAQCLYVAFHVGWSAAFLITNGSGGLQIKRLFKSGAPYPYILFAALLVLWKCWCGLWAYRRMSCLRHQGRQGAVYRQATLIGHSGVTVLEALGGWRYRWRVRWCWACLWMRSL